jgi:hypothetical protein
MLVKFMGILDIVCSIIIILCYNNILPFQPLISVALYLILKAVIFFGDILSIVDAIVGILILINLLVHSSLIVYIAVIYLIFKGGISML